MTTNLEVWNGLNNLVQLLYSTTDVNLVVSEYKNQSWQLHQQRQPIASSPDQFVKWFSSNMIQGHLSLITTGTLKIGDKEEWLELQLKPINDINLRQEFSWQLLLKFTQYIQKQGCVIDLNSSSASLINKLQVRLKFLFLHRVKSKWLTCKNVGFF
ncbi:hypothetical protein BDC45DRAFT_527228 [Circinella umbellata]|nr:hypothetical protein BDC45DRAFT_527228 [Circinella umbellata]